LRARSSLALLLVAGCDVVIGLESKIEPCRPVLVDPETGTDIVDATSSSIDWDEQFAILRTPGAEVKQYTLPDGPLTESAIDLGIYDRQALALVPEGDALFFTAAIEPPILQGAVRVGQTWRLVDELPVGTMAGTPSAREFGPRRVLVRLRMSKPEVQEFEEVAGRWEPIGSPLLLPGDEGPNLTPNGLTLVFQGTIALTDEGGASLLEGIFVAGRATVDEPFDEPELILDGNYNSPQLLGRCSRLYVVDQPTARLRRFTL
jgi:hypothetical protein